MGIMLARGRGLGHATHCDVETQPKVLKKTLLWPNSLLCYLLKEHPNITLMLIFTGRWFNNVVAM